MKGVHVFARLAKNGIVGILALAGLVAGAAVPEAHAGHAGQPIAAPKSGGTLYIRENNAPDCLDPQKTQFAITGDMDFAVFDTLVTLDPNGHLQPALALKWSFSHGGRWITFSLRHGVRFSNGDTLDASAVKASFDRVLNPATKAGVSAGAIGSLQSVHVVNKYTVRFVFSTPFRPFLTNLSLAYLGILDAKAAAKQGTGVCRTPIGSGPFKVQSVGPGFNTIKLVRNPLHTWGFSWAKNKHAAYLSSIVFRPIGDEATATSELISGGVQIATRISGAQIGRLQDKSGIRVLRYLQQNESYISFNIAHPPLDKLAVRKAFAQAIDRAALVKAAVNGLGTPVYAPLPPSVPDWDPAAKNYAYKYDPAQARTALTANNAAGPYTLLTFSEAEGQPAAEFLQAEFSQIGANVKVTVKPSVDVLAQAEQGQFDILYLGWQYADPDILYLFWHSSQWKHGGLDYLFHKYPALDKLLVQGRETLNEKKAASIYAKVQRYLVTNALMVPLFAPGGYTGLSTRIGGYHTNKANQIVYQDLYLTS